MPDHGAAERRPAARGCWRDAEAHNQIIIEDGYDSQLLDEAPAAGAEKRRPVGGRVVYVGSMSKTLAPGLRLGYIVASAD